jgi:hypothetical protein
MVYEPFAREPFGPLMPSVLNLPTMTPVSADSSMKDTDLGFGGGFGGGWGLGGTGTGTSDGGGFGGGVPPWSGLGNGGQGLGGRGGGGGSLPGPCKALILLSGTRRYRLSLTV